MSPRYATHTHRTARSAVRFIYQGRFTAVREVYESGLALASSTACQSQSVPRCGSRSWLRYGLVTVLTCEKRYRPESSWAYEWLTVLQCATRFGWASLNAYPSSYGSGCGSVTALACESAMRRGSGTWWQTGMASGSASWSGSALAGVGRQIHRRLYHSL